jgi:hypothetical protein
MPGSCLWAMPLPCRSPSGLLRNILAWNWGRLAAVALPRPLVSRAPGGRRIASDLNSAPSAFATRPEPIRAAQCSQGERQMAFTRSAGGRPGAGIAGRAAGQPARLGLTSSQRVAGKRHFGWQGWPSGHRGWHAPVSPDAGKGWPMRRASTGRSPDQAPICVAGDQVGN